jgi:hypothetical protein
VAYGVLWRAQLLTATALCRSCAHSLQEAVPSVSAGLDAHVVRLVETLLVVQQPWTSICRPIIMPRTSPRTALLLIYGATLWFVAGFLAPVRDRLGVRFADWLLPEGQASTFRVAYTIALTASLLTPGVRRVAYGDGDLNIFLERRPAPDLVSPGFAEFRNAMREGPHVSAPARRALRLLAACVSLRAANLRERVVFARMVTLIGMLLFVAVLLSPGFAAVWGARSLARMIRPPRVRSWE